MIYYIIIIKSIKYKLYWVCAAVALLSGVVLFFELMGLIFGKKRFARKIKNFNWGWIFPLAFGVGGALAIKKMYPEEN